MNMTLGRTWPATSCHSCVVGRIGKHHEGVLLVLLSRGAACCEMLTRGQRSVMLKYGLVMYRALYA